MSKIKFGTDGWRAIIAKDYTIENVQRVTAAVSKWMKEQGMTKAVIGFDCRFGGKLFMDTATQVFGTNGIKVYKSDSFVSTPMVSLAVLKMKADMGIVITASHNPPSYNGYKLKSAFGGPTIPKDITAVENMILDHAPSDLDSMEEIQSKGLIEEIDMEQMYIDHVKAHFDLNRIYSSGINLAYDAMYGAGQNVIRRLFPDATLLHCSYNPSFMGQAPEPIHRNLGELSATLKNNPKLNLGLANDGDADRIGLYDEDGLFVDSHHILLLLLQYMHEYKKEKGNVVITASVTNKMEKLAAMYGRKVEITKIGFKYIAEIMTQREVLVGGEESGGLAVNGHIPERDGIWMGLLIMEFMAITGKSLKALIADVYKLVGSFWFERDDLHISEEQKQRIIEKCKQGAFDHVGNRKIVKTITTDGFRFIFENEDWLLVRPSGTEPVLRVYAQSADKASVRALLDDAHATLQG